MVRLRKIVAEVSLPPQQQSAYHRLHRSTQMLLILGWCTSSRLVHLRQVHPLEGTLTICADLWNLWENIRSKKFCEFCEICGRIYSAKPSVQICEICGRIHSARSSVNSVKSVGDPLLRRRQDTSATMKICGRIHAVSVDSVGGHTVTARR